MQRYGFQAQRHFVPPGTQVLNICGITDFIWHTTFQKESSDSLEAIWKKTHNNNTTTKKPEQKPNKQTKQTKKTWTKNYQTTNTTKNKTKKPHTNPGESTEGTYKDWQK